MVKSRPSRYVIRTELDREIESACHLTAIDCHVVPSKSAYALRLAAAIPLVARVWISTYGPLAGFEYLVRVSTTCASAVS